MLNMKVVRWIGIIVMGIIVGVGINQVFKTLISNNMPQSQEIILQGATVIPTKKIQNSQITVTSDDAQCNAKVTVWANQMHDVLIMMIETDDTKPKATQTSF